MYEVTAAEKEVAKKAAKSIKKMPKINFETLDIKKLIDVVVNKDDKKYAQDYYDWVSKGKSGAAPKAVVEAGGRPRVKAWAFIRRAVYSILNKEG